MTNNNKAKPDGLRRNWKFWLGMISWIVIWLWLKVKTDFPDSFGHHSKLHGKAGVFEEYWYSPLLLHHPGFWELALFVWMWAIVVLAVGWIAWLGWQDFNARRKVRSQSTGFDSEE